MRSEGKRHDWGNLLLWALVGIGIALRLREYVFGRSLWLDEAMLANNVADRTFLGLLRPLADDQVCPVGLLFLFKAATVLFGATDYALRLVPLLSGIALLLTARPLLRDLGGVPGAALGLALLACNRQLIYFANEVKQYESEAAVVLGVLLALHLYGKGRLSFGWLVGIGAAALFFAHTALFAVAAAGGVLLLDWLDGRAPEKRRRFLVAGGVWFFAAGAEYALFLRHAEGNGHLQGFWAEGFPPGIAAELAANLAWIGHEAWHLFDFAWVWQAGTPHGWTLLSDFGLAFLLVAGVPFLVVRERRCAVGIAFFGLAILAAAAAHAYPLARRLTLFLIPVQVLLIAVGFAGIVRLLRLPGWTAARLAALLAAVLVLPPASRAAKHFAHPKNFQDVKGVVRLLREKYRPGDAILVEISAEHAYRFYARQWAFAAPTEPVAWEERGKAPSLASRLRDETLPATVWLVSGVVSDGANPAKEVEPRVAPYATVTEHDSLDEADLHRLAPRQN